MRQIEPLGNADHHPGTAGLHRAMRRMVRLLATGLVPLLAFGTAACGSQTDTASAPQQSVTRRGRVHILFPSDGLPISGLNSANKWSTLASKTRERLLKRSFPKDSLTVSQQGSVSDQVAQLTRLARQKGAGRVQKGDTILLAPAYQLDGSLEGLGNMAGDTEKAIESGTTISDRNAAYSSMTSTSTAPANAPSSGNSSQSRSATFPLLPTNDKEDAGTVTGADDASRARFATALPALAKALSSLQKRGASVVLCSRWVPGFHPDAFVRTVDPYEVGRRQARKLMAKVRADLATPSNPKRLVVLVPGHKSDPNAQMYCQGVWSVIGPNLRKGTATLVGAPNVTTVAGFLSSPSTDPNFLQGKGGSGVRQSFSTVLDQALAKQKTRGSSKKPSDSPQAAQNDDSAPGSEPGNLFTGSKTVRVDGVIALTDFTAGQVSTTLSDREYTGSAADVNPEITLSGIVGHIAGHRDLSKHQVPDPSESAQDPAGGSDSDQASSQDKRWPIITGFGGYADNIGLVTSGKQWMTGIVDEDSLADDLALMCQNRRLRENLTNGVQDLRLVSIGSPGTASSGSTRTRKGETVQVLSARLTAVSGANLKTALIDTGYVTAADAGL